MGNSFEMAGANPEADFEAKREKEFNIFGELYGKLPEGARKFARGAFALMALSTAVGCANEQRGNARVEGGLQYNHIVQPYGTTYDQNYTSYSFHRDSYLQASGAITASGKAIGGVSYGSTETITATGKRAVEQEQEIQRAREKDEHHEQQPHRPAGGGGGHRPKK